MDGYMKNWIDGWIDEIFLCGRMKEREDGWMEIRVCKKEMNTKVNQPFLD